ncbi:MBL fold metallo-hydrolase [Paenibacillus harenae]|uniref:MBL fold metallo-hydrolase n=1 Tax=Paenibacillus harenae TaxID=306543 RepID=UPI00278EBFFE|nr:MBL fold metallo-hydrolase [Paenibacillus harenae]MDQ0061377.1 L-ascorbate metabolism protein UlaG (beta-lactamase superfamily) [Paenibacillus harenae]
MIIQRLPWAGIRISEGDIVIVIDPISRILEEFGGAHEPMYPLSFFGNADAVLITHLHEDHFDPDAIIKAYGAAIPVYVPNEVAETARAAGLTNVNGVAVGTSFEIGGDVKVTALPSVDGLGDVQSAWVVEGGGRKVIHCGDTLWHGFWWGFAKNYGPFDAAFLPVNGAVLRLPGMMPSGQPICLTPEQAVAAAAILGAVRLVPIHYGTMQNPPIYNETPDIADRLAAASEGKVNISMIKATETVTL